MTHTNRWFLALVLTGLLATLGQAQTRKDIRIPNIPGFVTLKCDFHMHTVFSDGEVWPTVRVKEAYREGLDAICITDHIEYQPHKADLPTQHNRPYDIAKGLAKELDIILVKGSEITRGTPPGHYNALFVTDSEALGSVQKDFDAIMAEAGRQQAFIFWNHHTWKGEDKGQWTDVQTGLLEKGFLHGMEVVNGGTYYHSALDWCSQKNLTMMGNSDIHAPSLEEDNNLGTHRSITLVFARERSHDAIRDALFAHRTAVWGDDHLYGRPEFLRPLAEEILTVGKPFPIKDKTWGIYVSNNSCIPLELSRAGDFGPAKLSIPQDATVLARFDIEGDPDTATVNYRVDNFWIGDKKPVTISKEVSGFAR